MCLPVSDVKARRLLQLGSICLVLGLLPQVFGLTFGLSPVPRHFLSGLFLGISIATNFGAVRLRCRRTPAPGA